MPPEDSQIENLPSGDGSGDKPDDEDLYDLGGWQNQILKKLKIFENHERLLGLREIYHVIFCAAPHD